MFTQVCTTFLYHDMHGNIAYPEMPSCQTWYGFAKRQRKFKSMQYIQKCISCAVIYQEYSISMVLHNAKDPKSISDPVHEI